MKSKELNTETYEGWKNYDTWNVALWINNDYNLYVDAVNFMAKNKTLRAPYRAFIISHGLTGLRTPDRCSWLGRRLDYKELDDMMREFNE
jgi:hypothetical protein